MCYNHLDRTLAQVFLIYLRESRNWVLFLNHFAYLALLYDFLFTVNLSLRITVLAQSRWLTRNMTLLQSVNKGAS